jgi:hypothetical protein
MRGIRLKTIITAAALVAAAITAAGVVAMRQRGDHAKTVAKAAAAADTLIVEPGTATRGGITLGAGSARTLTARDAEEIGRQCPAIDEVAPVVHAKAQLVYGHRNWMPACVYGTTPSFVSVCNWEDLAAGAMFGDQDVRSSSPVCVIGETVRHRLFDEEPAVGKQVRIEDALFRIIGVLSSKCAGAMDIDQDDIVLVPWTTIKCRISGVGAAGGSQGSLRRFSHNFVSGSLFSAPRYSRLANVDRILVKTASSLQVPLATEEIISLLRQRHNIGPREADDFSIRDLADASK